VLTIDGLGGKMFGSLILQSMFRTNRADCLVWLSVTALCRRQDVHDDHDGDTGFIRRGSTYRPTYCRKVRYVAADWSHDRVGQTW